MSATEATARGAIDDEVAVADFQDVGSSTATWALGPAVPRPTVVADEPSSACAEGVVFALALSNGRGVVDIGSAYLCREEAWK